MTLEMRTGGERFSESHVLNADDEEVMLTNKESGITTIEHLSRFPQILKDKKILVLVNGGTASAAEMLAAALKENGRAIVLGTKTFGKGIAQTSLPIANGTVLSVTCVHYFTPAGHFLGFGKKDHGDGLEPDKIVENGSDVQDAQLQRALSILASAL